MANSGLPAQSNLGMLFKLGVLSIGDDSPTTPKREPRSGFNNDFVLIDSDPSVSVLSPVEIVVGHLNDVLKPARPYSVKTKKTVEHVNARIRDGYTADDICKVIDMKFAEWFGDPKMEQYIRPETLFGTGKFESYLIAAENWIQRGRPSFKNNNNNRNNGQSNIADNDKSFAGAFK